MTFDPATVALSDVIATVSVLVAIGALIVAIVAGVSAGKSAERATRASERMSSIQATIFAGAAWTVSAHGSSSYLITNISPLPAENVRIYPDPGSDRFTWQDPEGVTIEPWSATMFRIAYGMRNGDSIRADIVVEWNRPGELETRVWRHPVPIRSATK